MIINYSNFLLESKYQDIKDKHHSIGEYLEKISEDDDYLISIINNYIKDSDTDIRISNAVNLLSDFDKKQLFYRVENYLSNGEKEKEVDVMANVVLESVSVSGGKGIFNSFLKSMTALGMKNIAKSEDTPINFLYYYKSLQISTDLLKSIFSRFKSLTMFIDLIDYTHNTCNLYYGIKSDSTFEYGFATDKNNTPIGNFKLNRSTLNWLVLLQSPSAISLKKDLVSLDIKDIVFFNKISIAMREYNLNSERVGPNINGDIITFGYYGVGKWDGKGLEDESYNTLRSDFKSWLSKYKWSRDVMINVSYNSFWVYFNIKLK